jgi:4-amino-4-deoxy-L-arabinose transferase-like glycosyltransferase
LHLLFLGALTFLTLLPFTEKAFHIDDPLFIWAAKHIQTEPLDPYGFNVNWYGALMPMSGVTKNPPLTSYYVAGVAAAFGWNERSVHLAFLLPALAVIIGTYMLAERFCARPLLASLCALFTPVFLVSGSTVMSDILMLALWIGAIYLWVSGMETGSPLRLLLSGICIALCAVAKYFGMTLIPLLLAYTLLNQRRVGWAIAYLLVPVFILGAYQWGTHALYGRGLLLDAASYATETRSHWSLSKVLVGMAFTGGCMGASCLFMIWPSRSKTVVVGAAVALAIALGAAMTRRIGTYALQGSEADSWIMAAVFGLFATGGVGILAIAVADLVKQKDAEALLLCLWVLGTFAFAALINWSINGRSILPMIPAVGILMMRRMEQRGKGRKQPSVRQIVAVLAGAAVLAGGVGWADWVYADSARRAAKEIHEKFGNRQRPLLFGGHWGFQYYMEALGGTAVDVKTTQFHDGDILVLPENNTNVFRRPDWTTQLGTVEVSSSKWIATMRSDLGAGFYADVFGPLPYVFAKVPPERYRILEVTLPGSG